MAGFALGALIAVFAIRLSGGTRESADAGGVHGARCDICMGEAMLATQFAVGGSTLQQIRRAIDERFGP